MMSSREASIFDVARYLLNHLGDMTTMKLEKLAYYCLGWSLAWDGVPLFPEDFEAWANRPVCPKLFETHRQKFSVDRNFYGSCDPSVFTQDQIETMDAVIKEYGEIPPEKLSELVHRERPWKETRGDTPSGEKCSRVIEKDLMQDYYGGICSA